MKKRHARNYDLNRSKRKKKDNSEHPKSEDKLLFQEKLVQAFGIFRVVGTSFQYITKKIKSILYFQMLWFPVPASSYTSRKEQI